ncbi:MAG TPA: response regulator [bacterium]|nr:response regulator [bacterium]HOL47405.1 response regulator [bacterium]HPQ18568.1 response regulator [bacterium]
MPYNILIVDDSATMRMLVKMTLKTFPDINTFEAKDGVEAIEICANNKMDLVITDLNMPEMNGFDFIRYLRKNPNYKDVQIIVLSTEGRDDDKEQAMRLGANDYIVKPFQPFQLQAKVKKILNL